MRFLPANQLLDMDLVRRFGIVEGLAIPVRTDAGEGMLLLHGISSLCTDHIEFAASIGTAFGDYIQRNALLSAVQDNAAVRARLSLARDLHDSIVQFLAGATFRIEAIGRAIRSGDRPARELDDLKQLMLEEQQELRSAIGALRSSRISLPRLASDLKALCDRLARQWDISCGFTAEVPDSAVPMRLHLDTHQLVREAVANAVRHAGAKSINVHMSAEQLNLRLDISNDGNGKVRLKEGHPWSLRERVDEANGTLMLASRKTGTNVSITLPLMPEPQP
jgi:signal transduction histidine kinase